MGTLAADSGHAELPREPHPAQYRRAWRVLHACERLTEVLPVLEGQLAAGMRPALVTLSGSGSLAAARDDRDHDHTPSLMNAWADVRKWRKSLLESGAEAQVEVVHAHGFAPGMAAVRSCPTVVYDVHGFVEEAAIAGGQCEERSWLARSFRVAEQFVLSRAAAVVVHSSPDRHGTLQRGASSECVFVIPQPVELETPLRAEPGWWSDHGLAPDALNVFAADADLASVRFLLGAAERARAEATFNLLLGTDGPAAPHLNGNHAGVVVVGPEHRTQAFAAADIVIAGNGSGALEGMRHAKAVLAADLPCNRDVSPSGRGCLWYREGDARDLALRLAALAANPEFRAAVADAGRKHIEETRSPAVVGTAYDAVYRFAHARRRSTSLHPPLGSLQPLNACF